ncbi:MAG TPA: hypothetical protein VNM34_14410 [Verrucomicrobiae bacterium]|nr:hypothetical protein [Verrucomicrobiae bacterium]
MSFGAHLFHIGHEIEERGWGGVVGAVTGVLVVGIALTALYRPSPPGPRCDIVEVTRIAPVEWLFRCADGRLIRSQVEAGLAPYLIGALVGALIGKWVWDLMIDWMKSKAAYR